MEDSTEPIVIARFNYRHEAEMAKGYLDDAGVDSALFIDDAGGADVGLAFSNPGRLVVPQHEAERARAVLEQVGILEEASS